MNIDAKRVSVERSAVFLESKFRGHILGRMNQIQDGNPVELTFDDETDFENLKKRAIGAIRWLGNEK